MKTINQRELRNDNAEVMREVEQGQSFTVTKRGVPVAKLSPIAEASDLRCLRPAKKQVAFSDMPRLREKISMEEVLSDLRGDR